MTRLPYNPNPYKPAVFYRVAHYESSPYSDLPTDYLLWLDPAWVLEVPTVKSLLQKEGRRFEKVELVARDLVFYAHVSNELLSEEVTLG